ncbi:hypothetical protein [Arsenicicoccus sp. oral taxon 190]|uniref:hypothetical protein n=1 Tax=Arsenicicoccus sp. oral taxon 190 TaxID=1658671 RepID=UPI00067A2935|nr:hypothetical protein [Arsenicicoccus sp. oral taxon 190]AKT50733.1 hypothetical protein ADJ73_04360 [Arsenicicoccus sp. oral taxon 190]
MNPFLTEAFADSLLDQTMGGVAERGGWLGSFVAKRLTTVSAGSLIEMPGPYADALSRLKAVRGEAPDPRDTDEGRAWGYSWVERSGVMPVVLVAWLIEGQSPVHVEAFTKAKAGDTASAERAIADLAARLRVEG